MFEAACVNKTELRQTTHLEEVHRVQQNETDHFLNGRSLGEEKRTRYDNKAIVENGSRPKHGEAARRVAKPELMPRKVLLGGLDVVICSEIAYAKTGQ